MARSLDIETLIEDAFITHLPTYVTSTDVTIKRWEDIKIKDVTPSVKIKATVTDEEEGTINLFASSKVLVDIAAFTSKRIDEDGRTANGLRGQVRELVNQDDIVTLLNQETGLLVYNNGVIPQTSVDAEGDRIWQKMTSVLIVATSTE